jgi:single-stranded DNA-binding protein
MYYNINKSTIMGTVEKIETNDKGNMRITVSTFASVKTNDEWQRQKEFHTVIVPSSKAQYVSKLVTTNAEVYVEGTLKYRELPDKRRVAEIVVEDFTGNLQLVLKASNVPSTEQREWQPPKQSGGPTVHKEMTGHDINVPF